MFWPDANAVNKSNEIDMNAISFMTIPPFELQAKMAFKDMNLRLCCINNYFKIIIFEYMNGIPCLPERSRRKSLWPEVPASQQDSGQTLAKRLCCLIRYSYLIKLNIPSFSL